MIKMYLLYALTTVVAYLIGSFSPGIVLAKRVGDIDIREYGSKSTGATNALRVMGLPIGFLVFLIDICKSFLSCFLGGVIMAQYDPSLSFVGSMVAGLLAVIGHNWPIYYEFRGGKGVAVSIAACLYLFPIYGLISSAIAILVIAITRYVSLGSMSFLLAFAIMIFCFFSSNIFYCVWALALLIMVIYKHRTNIQRLLNGCENKLGKRKK